MLSIFLQLSSVRKLNAEKGLTLGLNATIFATMNTVAKTAVIPKVRYLWNRKHNKLLVDGVKMTAARVAAGYSGAEVARLLGCDKASICRYEQNKSVPPDRRIYQMAKLYDTRDFVVKKTEGKK